MTVPRNRRHLTEPPAPSALEGRFPALDYPSGSMLHRCHGTAFTPWWFSSSGRGRFDLVDPHGTCYAAETELIALQETWGGIRIVPGYDLDGRSISALRIAGTRTVADLTSNRGTEFGVTAEIFTTGNYQLTQRWATALHGAGYTGVRYWARHDLAHQHACVALFGESGDRTAVAGHDVDTTAELWDRPGLLDDLRTDTGITVLPIPPLRGSGTPRP